MWDLKTASALGIAVAILCTQGAAQGPLVMFTVESTTIKPGQTANVKLVLTIPHGTQAAGLNWTLRYPARAMEDVVISAGSAADAAKKSLQCSSVSGETKCLVFGLNTNLLASGTLATVSFRMRKEVEESKVEIQVVDLVVASVSGTSIPCTGSSGSISIRK